MPENRRAASGLEEMCEFCIPLFIYTESVIA